MYARVDTGYTVMLTPASANVAAIRSAIIDWALPPVVLRQADKRMNTLSTPIAVHQLVVCARVCGPTIDDEWHCVRDGRELVAAEQ
jgi:hypothetical protein